MPAKRKRSYSSRELSALLDLTGEAGILKSVQRSGWWMIGIKNGETVAEHSFRAALIGYLLARMEGVEPYPVVMMALLNDLHKVGHRYIDFRAAEKKASAEQTANLPPAIRKELARWSKELHDQSNRASVIARDADLLECMIQGKEYAERGYPKAISWMTRPMHLLKTKSAKALAKRLKSWKSDRWWQHLVTLAR